MKRTVFSSLTTIIAVFALTIAGCQSEESAAPAAAATGPTLSDVSLIGNPNPTVPLAAILKVTTDRLATLTINFDDGERQWSVTPSNDMATMHEVPVLGMRAGRMHTISATLTDADGNESVSADMAFETPTLPDAFPTPRITVHNEAAMEPGVTLFNVNGRWGADGKSAPENFSPAVIVNSNGEIIWSYLPEGHRVHDIHRLANGNFAYEVWPGTAGLIEIDMLGNIVRRWHFSGTAQDIAEGSIAVPTDTIHHDYVELPNGNLLLLSSENRVVEDWPTSETDADAPKATANVIGDVIIEMTPAGEVLREWKLHDIMDPYRIGYNSLREDFWSGHYGDFVDGVVHDWTHGNAIIYEEENNAFVLSLPYQDAVVKISMETGELVWILGNHDNWREPWTEKLLTPVGEVGWSYKHHAISHTENGTYLLYDNGVARSSPYDEKMAVVDSYTRAVEYKVNEATMEVEQVWVYGPDDEPFYARYLGDTDWLPQTDNILVTIGAQETNAEGQNAPPGPGTQRWARLVELTHDQPAEKVWEMRLQEDDSNWSIYRSERIPSVYP
jgi:arylsulfate sulfotransferase